MTAINAWPQWKQKKIIQKRTLNTESSSLCMNKLDYLVCQQESTHLTFFFSSLSMQREFSVTAVTVEFITEEIPIHDSTATVVYFISSSMQAHSPLHASLQFSGSVCLFFHSMLHIQISVQCGLGGFLSESSYIPSSHVPCRNQITLNMNKSNEVDLKFFDVNRRTFEHLYIRLFIFISIEHIIFLGVITVLENI